MVTGITRFTPVVSSSVADAAPTRGVGFFARNITFPSKVDSDTAKASMQHFTRVQKDDSAGMPMLGSRELNAQLSGSKPLSKRSVLVFDTGEQPPDPDAN